MTLTNFHCHTFLCNHANGSVEDLIVAAKNAGCGALGISDHNPYPDDTWSATRMTPGQMKGYVDDVRQVAKTVDFPVYLGFECEYDPRYLDWLKYDVAEKAGADFMVYGSHWVYDDRFHCYVYIPSLHDKKLLIKYTDLTVEGIKTGIWTFLAHPDLPMAFLEKWDSEAKACLGAILDAAIDCNLPIEINGLGMTRQKHCSDGTVRYQYPFDDFWYYAKEKGAKVICNSDAHDFADVIDGHIRGRDYARKIGFTEIVVNPITGATEAP